MRIPLSYGFGVISAAAVIATAVAVALLAVNTTNNMIDDSIDSHTTTMREFSQYQVENFFNKVALVATELQVAIFSDNRMPFPSELRGSPPFDRMWSMLEPYIHVDSRLTHILVLLRDGSVIRTKRFRVKDRGTGNMTTVITSYGWDAASQTRHMRSYRLRNHEPFNHSATYPFDDVNASQHAALTNSMQLVDGGDVGDRFWMPMTHTYFPTEVVLPVAAVLHNATKVRLGTLLVATSVAPLHELLLEAADNVPGAMAVVVDGHGMMVATSDTHVPVINRTYFDSHEQLSVGRDCAASAPEDPELFVACRMSIADYSAATISELLAAFLQIDLTQQSFRIGIGSYFVEHRRLQSVVGTNYDLHLIVFYPKQQLLAELQRVVNIIIIVAALVAASFATIAVVVGNLMVRPLSGVSSQLESLARLSFPKHLRGPTSTIQEVARLEAALTLLARELRKISTYVPMSLREPQQSPPPLSSPCDNPATCTSTHPSATAATPVPAPKGEAISSEAEEGFINILGDDQHPRVPHQSHTSHSSSSGTSGESGPRPAAGPGISAALLNSAVNHFTAKRFAFVSVRLGMGEDSAANPETAAAFGSAFLNAVQHHGGVVERLEPRHCTASFGAHSATHAPQKQAVEAAIRIALALHDIFLLGSFTVVVDCAMGFIGPFGSSATKALTVFGDVVSTCEKLHDFCQYYLPVSLLLTERVAGASAHGSTVPVDVVRFYNDGIGPDSTSLALYTVTSAPPDDPTVAAARRVFVDLRSGNYDAATAEAEPCDPIIERLRAAACFARCSGAKEYYRQEAATRWDLSGARDAAVVSAAPGASTSSLPLIPDPITATDISRSLKKAQEAQMADQEEEEEGAGIVTVFAARGDELPRRITDMQGTEWVMAQHPHHIGQHAALFKAVNAATGILAVAKVAALDAATDVTGIEREIRLLLRLNHECIVAVTGHAITSGHAALLMEIVPGGSLADAISAFGRLELSLVRCYFRDIFLALERLQQEGVAHLDVCPANVLLTGDGRCKLGGFALAASVATGEPAALVRASPGRVPYLAPEIARREPPTPGSDVWSVAVMLLEALTGEWRGLFPDFSSGSSRRAESTFVSRLACDASFTPAIPPELPAALREVIALCLARDAAVRPTAARILRTSFFLTL